MPLNPVIEPGCEWTSPENRGVCGFCGGEEGGYAKRDENGKWQPACWPCVRPATSEATQLKRATVGTTYTDDNEVDKPTAPKADKLSVPRVKRTIDSAEAVAMYQAGRKISDIAVHFGYAPGQGQNATREVLKAAGIYKKSLQ